jgi:hypothetical protein
MGKRAAIPSARGSEPAPEKNVMSKKRKSFIASMDLYDWFFIVAAFISICYGLYRAIDLGPDWWGNVAGPLFSLASGFLFFVALRMQMREHRHAIEEMKQNNVNHAELLLVAKQEKEFNVLLSAHQDVKAHLDSIRHGITVGLQALREITQAWMKRFDQRELESQDGFRNHFRDGSFQVDEVLPNHRSIQALVLKCYWIFHSVCPRTEGGPPTKELDPRDCALIFTLIMPTIADIQGAIGPNISSLIQRLKEIEALPEGERLRLRINPDSIRICRHALEEIESAKTRRDYGTKPVAEVIA